MHQNLCTSLYMGLQSAPSCRLMEDLETGMVNNVKVFCDPLSNSTKCKHKISPVDFMLI